MKPKTIARRAGARVPALPHPTDWRTTDADELAKRRLRAREERHRITNVDPAHPIFSNFEVQSPTGMTYRAEIRDVASREVFLHLYGFPHQRAQHLQAHRGYPPPACPSSPGGIQSRAAGLLIARWTSFRTQPPAVCACHATPPRCRAVCARASTATAFSWKGWTPRRLVAEIRTSRSQSLRISQDVEPWLEARSREHDRILSRREYEAAVANGNHPEHVTRSPLFPYQREGMLHLVFNERALLADEMGLGKTIQAIAACALLRNLGKARRVLIVTPASLKAEWEEQIGKFTGLPLRLVYGGRALRSQIYSETDAPFFTIANYEQIVADSLDINARLRPDIVILDEAQRIKNWATKTAQAVKRLQSRYAFVLTGTPIENRIDELRSIVDFLDPAILGPLFRFNREYYDLDERGRPVGYKNLDKLRERVRVGPHPPAQG